MVDLSDVRDALSADEFSYQALADRLGADALPYLSQLVTSGDVHLASKAVYLASLIPHPGTESIVTQASASGTVELRAAAAMAATNLGPALALRTALPLAGDSDASVRRLALRAIPGGREDDPSRRPPAQSYRVRRGDSLYSIAKDQLNDGDRWPEILLLNRKNIDDPNLISTGLKLTLPGIEPMNLRPELYLVEPEDNLSRIALQELGDSARWPEIFALNRPPIEDPRIIHPGMRLIMPL